CYRGRQLRMQVRSNSHPDWLGSWVLRVVQSSLLVRPIRCARWQRLMNEELTSRDGAPGFGGPPRMDGSRRSTAECLPEPRATTWCLQRARARRRRGEDMWTGIQREVHRASARQNRVDFLSFATTRLC